MSPRFLRRIQSSGTEGAERACDPTVAVHSVHLVLL